MSSQCELIEVLRKQRLTLQQPRIRGMVGMAVLSNHKGNISRFYAFLLVDNQSLKLVPYQPPKDMPPPDRRAGWDRDQASTMSSTRQKTEPEPSQEPRAIVSSGCTTATIYHISI